MMSQSKGMTLLGMLLTLAIVVLAGITVMKIIPVYIEYYTVNSSVSALNRLSVNDLPNDENSRIYFLHKKVKNQLYINGIEPEFQSFKIKPLNNNKYAIKIHYEQIKHLVGHMSLLFEFDVDKEVHIGN